MRNVIVLFLLIYILSSCTEEQLDCLEENNRIERYYNELILEAAGNLDEQARLEELKQSKMSRCFSW